MNNTEVYAELKKLAEKYDFTATEKEAIHHAAYLAKKKVEDEKAKARCMYYIGDYKFHSFDDALKMANSTYTLKNSFILEKRLDENGNGKTKKYKLSNGKILGVYTV